jgi:hypothetical protein
MVKFMKLHLVIIICILSLALLAGCGGEKKPEQKAPGTVTQTPAVPTMPKIEPGTPQAAYKDMADAVAAFDGAKLYGLLSTGSKTQLDSMLANMKKEPTFAKSPFAAVTDGAGLLAKQFESYKNEGGHGLDAMYKDQGFLAGALNDCKVEGDKATITEPNGGLVTLLKEGGAWKIDLPANYLMAIPPKPTVPKNAQGAV